MTDPTTSREAIEADLDKIDAALDALRGCDGRAFGLDLNIMILRRRRAALLDALDSTLEPTEDTVHEGAIAPARLRDPDA